MKTILAICVALIFCSISRAETFGLGDADPPSQLASVVAVEPIADTFGLGVSYPAGEPVVYGQEVVSACPGGVCPLPQTANRKVVVTDPFMTRANTVTTQPVVVSRVTCPNCPVPTVATRAMPVAAVDCPCGCGIVGCNCRAQASPLNYSNISRRSTWLESHLQLEHGIDTTGMSPADMQATHDAIHAAEGSRVVRWNGPIVRAIRNRPVLFPRIRAFFGR